MQYIKKSINSLQIFLVSLFGQIVFSLMHNIGLRNTNARCIILSNDNCIALVRTNFFEELILPGGSVDEYGEQPIDAALQHYV
jgi:hypothetical protein